VGKRQSCFEKAGAIAPPIGGESENPAVPPPGFFSGQNNFSPYRCLVWPRVGPSGFPPALVTAAESRPTVGSFPPSQAFRRACRESGPALPRAHRFFGDTVRCTAGGGPPLPGNSPRQRQRPPEPFGRRGRTGPLAVVNRVSGSAVESRWDPLKAAADAQTSTCSYSPG